MLTLTCIDDMANKQISVAFPHREIAAKAKTVIFDSQIEDLNLLLDGLHGNVQAHVLNQDHDGLEQITTFLQQNPSQDLTLIAHGFPGGIRLGSSLLDRKTLDHYAQQLQQWFVPNGQAQLTLMACNVAQGSVGQAFIQQLADITSAEIIASSQILGNGNWLPAANALFTTETLDCYRSTLTWTGVGPTLGQDIANEFDIEVDSQGTPYIIFQDGSNDSKLTVKRFDGTNWVDVGTPGFPGGDTSFVGLEFDSNDTPYIAFRDSANKSRATVMQFNGSDWVYVGDPGKASVGGLKDISLTFDGDTPYIAYTDRSQNSGATVRTFDGTAWIDVGQPGFSSGAIEAADLNVDGNGIPYIAYLSLSGLTNKVTVQRFVNGQWTVVGTEAFSAGAESYAPDIEFDNNNVPYIVYRARGNGEGNKAIVETFNGTDWVRVGNSGASIAGGFHPDLEFDNNNVLHVAIVDQAKKDKVSVRVLEGNNWVYFGDDGFSIGPMNFPDLEFDANNIPYVLYRETFDDTGARIDSAVVKRLGDPPVIVDEIAPVLASIRRKDPIDEIVEGGTLVFEATFSEAVVDVDPEDFVINGLPTATIDTVTAIDSTRYEISVIVGASNSLDGVVGLDLAGGSDITDIAGNGLKLVEPAIDEVYKIVQPEIPVLPPEPEEPPVTEPEKPPVTEPEKPPVTEPEKPPVTEPEKPPVTEPEKPPVTEPETEIPSVKDDDVTGLLDIVPAINGVEVTELGSDNTIRLTFLQGTVTNVTEVLIFSEASSVNGQNEIVGQFSLLNYAELLMDPVPRFTVDSNAVASGDKFRFAIQDDGATLFATPTTLSESAARLNFGNGFSFNVELATETDTTNLLVNDAQSIDLTGQASTIAMEFSAHREAAMDNTVDLYAVDFANGGIIDELTGQTLMPGDPGYKEAAIANRLNLNLSGTNGDENTVVAPVTGGMHLGIFVIIDGVDPTTDEVFFSYTGANTTKHDYIKHLGDNAFGIEDQYDLGDRDFDDLVIQFSVV